MNVPDAIRGIIETRRNRLERISQAEEQLLSMKEIVGAFQTFRNELDSHTELAKQLKKIELKGFVVERGKSAKSDRLSECEATFNELERLKKRFSRDYVHMSFVGKARQGKSLLMQKISGLSGKVIPSADGDHCTGAKSIITNTDVDGVTADIIFYREEEIVEIVNKYLAAIFGRNEPKISRAGDIPGLKARKLENRLDIANTDVNALWEHLKKYIEYIGDFQGELGQEIHLQANTPDEADQIEFYVAQYKSTDPGTHYYKYLGVKEAHIYCRFPSHDRCGNLVLVDTVGLGDLVLGLEEEMFRAVREDSDAILYMCRPDIQGPIIDKEHYDNIKQIADKVSVDYAKEMLFWVVNRNMKGGPQTAKLISKLAERLQYQIDGGATAACCALDVDCMDTDEVETKLLAPILRQMSERLKAIDNLLVQRVQSRLDALFRDCQTLCGQIREAYTGAVSANDRHAFDPEIHKTISRWTMELRKLCNDMKQEQTEQNTEFADAFAEKVQALWVQYPEEEEIQDYLTAHLGQHDQFQLYVYLTQYTRNRIIDDFMRLDDKLTELVRDMKCNIVDILADDGLLGRVIPKPKNSENLNPNKWLTSLTQAAERGGYHSICHALRSLREFKISVEGLFIFAVRNALTPLDSALEGQLPEIRNGSVDMMASVMYNLLTDAMYAVEDSIRRDCQGYISFVNGALYAAARDFRDRSVFSVGSLTEDMEKVQQEWRYFYEDHIPEIWTKEYATLHGKHQIHEQFGDMIRQINQWENANQSMFQI